jgi:hypothetical protein
MNNNFIMPNSQEFFKEHALIKPPNVSTYDIPKRYYRYIIDSRDRNLHYFKSPNKYDIKLSEDVHDVQSVELISFDVPFTKYFIDQNNNTFKLKVGLTYASFKIPVGDYATGDLIVDELNKTSSQVVFSYNKINNKISIKNNSGTSATLSCRGPSERKNDYMEPSPTYTNQLMRIVGLDFDDHEVGANETFEFPYKVNLRHDKYIVMNLGQANVNVSENNSTNKSFAIIKTDELENKFIESNYKKYFNPPVNSLTTLSLSFNDYDGNLYDFQNQDHMIELLFCCFKQTRCYNDIYNGVNI